MKSLPIGLTYHHRRLQRAAEYRLHSFRQNTRPFHERKRRIFARWRRRDNNVCGSDHDQRLLLDKVVQEYPDMFYYIDHELPQSWYFQQLQDFQFIACPNGNGLDPSPRAWEAMILKTIPILVRTDPLVSDIYEDLPCIILDSWSELCDWSFLDKYQVRIHKIHGMLEDDGYLYKLSREYWITQILQESALRLCNSVIKMDVLTEWINRIEKKEPFLCLSMGVEEYVCASRNVSFPYHHQNTHAHVNSRLMDAFRYMVDEYKLPCYVTRWGEDSRVPNFWESIVNRHPHWVDPDIVNRSPLWEAIQQRTTILVGHKQFSTNRYVHISTGKWYDTKYEQILEQVKKTMDECEHPIVLVCCGVEGKLIIASLCRHRPEATYIDVDEPCLEKYFPAKPQKKFLLTFGNPTGKEDVDTVLSFDKKSPEIQQLIEQRAEHQFDQDHFLYFLWRPFLIHHVLDNYLEEGDVLIYTDKRVDNDLIGYLGGKDVALYNTSFLNKSYTKEDCFQYMGCQGGEYDEALQVDASVQCYRKSAVSLAFTKEYYEWCAQIETVDPLYRHPNKSFFKQHKQDQSVLTNLAVKYKDTVGRYNRNHKDEQIWVVTPTTGTPYLERCIASVQKQTLPVYHMVVVDGKEYEEEVHRIIDRFEKKPYVIVLPLNTGGNHWNGHRVYASAPLLLEATHLLYLDEDNWYEPWHVEKLYKTMKQHHLDWVHSLRKIWKNDECICHDNCESLGVLYPTVIHKDDYLVDTSSFMFRWDVALAVSPHWLHKVRQGDIEADRAVTQFLMSHRSRGGCSYDHSLNYTVAHISNQSVTQDFFLKGNQARQLDFTKPTVYVFHFNPQMTYKMLQSLDKNDRSYALDEWQMTLFRSLRTRYNLLNGFAISHVPIGAVAIITMCQSQDLPFDRLKSKDWKCVLYTVESPNIRHQNQWDLMFLKTHFDHVMTYWTPVLEDETFGTFCPQNSHHLDFDNPLDMALLVHPTRQVGRDVVMVLENRSLKGRYRINGTTLYCLDPLREAFIQDLQDITVYGTGWEKYKDHPKIRVGHTLHRSKDHRTTIDIMKDYTFVMIIENTDAQGYVSEKIYDAWIAGCIPLYYGNIHPRNGIPSNMYIDLKSFPSSEAVQEYLDSLDIDTIHGMRKTILDNRMTVLGQVSTKAFADTFDIVYQKMTQTMNG